MSSSPMVYPRARDRRIAPHHALHAGRPDRSPPPCLSPSALLRRDVPPADHLTFRSHSAVPVRVAPVWPFPRVVRRGRPRDPFAANPAQGVLYPPAWLAAVLPVPFGANLILVIDILFAGIGMAYFSRRLGAGEIGGALAGALSHDVRIRRLDGRERHRGADAGLDPVNAWAANRLALADDSRRDRLRKGIALAPLLALQILSGDPAGMVTSVLLAGIVILARAPRRGAALGISRAQRGSRCFSPPPRSSPLCICSGRALAGQGAYHRAGGRLVDAPAAHPRVVLAARTRRYDGDDAQRRGSLRIRRAEGGASHMGAERVHRRSRPVLRGDRGRGPPAGVARAVRRGGALRPARAGIYTPFYGIYRAVVLPERLVRYPEADVNVSVSLVGPTPCLPTLIPDSDTTDSDGSLKSPDLLTGPITNNGTRSSRLDWTALGMAPNEVRTVVRNYQVNCNQGGTLRSPNHR